MGKRLFSEGNLFSYLCFLKGVPNWNLETEDGNWQARLERDKNAIFYLRDGFPTIAEKAATSASDRPCDASARCQILIQAAKKGHASYYSFT